MGRPIMKVGQGHPCPKCGKSMERRKHSPEDKGIANRCPYYFSEWDYCKRCKHVQQYEQFRVTPIPKHFEDAALQAFHAMEEENG